MAKLFERQWRKDSGLRETMTAGLPKLPTDTIVGWKQSTFWMVVGMKKLLFLAIIFTMLTVFCTDSAYANDDIVIDKSAITSGTVSVTYKRELKKAVKVQISKGEVKYNYDIKDNKPTVFPLQSGTGEYTVMVLENVSDTKYRVVAQESFKLDKVDEKALYTQSIQLVNFNSGMASITDMSKLTAKAKTDTDKFMIAYEYVVANIKYDNEKAAKQLTGYLPVIDDTYKTSKGICFDYASLLASILRSNNIPCKLTMGYSPDINGYHAWNQALIDGKWVSVDTTYDAGAREYKISYSYAKDASKLTVVKEY